ncbi:MAG: cell division protein ZapA [Candidatus Babeliales bacterium]
MINKNKQCKVHIFGDEYSLVSNESEEHIKAAAHLVDSLIRDIAHKGSVHQDKKVVVLAALQLASKALLLEQELADKKLQEERLATLLDTTLEPFSS